MRLATLRVAGTGEPLQGVSVVVTRSAEQAEDLAAPLRELGAEVKILPAIEIASPRDLAALREAAAAVQDQQWIVFTSANAVRALARELTVSANQIGAAIVCVGSATAHAAAALGFPPAIIPEEYVAESLLPCFPADMRGQQVLIPRSALARDVIPDELRERGANVTVVEAYRNVTPEATLRDAPTVFASPPDWVLFASSSAVDHICQAVPNEVLSRSRLGSIGPVTSAALASRGLNVAMEAGTHTVAGLVQSLVSFYERGPNDPMP